VAMTMVMTLDTRAATPETDITSLIEKLRDLFSPDSICILPELVGPTCCACTALKLVGLRPAIILAPQLNGTFLSGLKKFAHSIPSPSSPCHYDDRQ